jgi:hypothetical protein
VIRTTVIIEITDIIAPYVSNDIITVVIAPGPARRGNANGTIPKSPDLEPEVVPPLNLHSPCVSNQ